MKNFISKNKYLFITFLASFVIFYPSLFVFYTNDDFFNLKIANVNSIGGFINFFNLLKGPDGWGLYRPLTTQAFYSLTVKFFNLSPFPLHIILFLLFFFLIFLVYKLIFLLSKNEKISELAAFLYATSVTHFGHLYFLSTQEMGLGVLVLLTIITGLKFYKKGRGLGYILSIVFFVLSLMSKETAVVMPILLGITIVFDSLLNGNKLELKKLAYYLLPYLVILIFYLYFRIFYYGFTTGDSYIWDFSVKKLFNTSLWYLLWSLNIPESLVDFIGPSLSVNPNIFLYWSSQFVPIFGAFFVQGILLVWLYAKVLINKTKDEMNRINMTSFFCIGWFFISLLPVIFLPEHKFTFYLTLPLIAVVFRIAYLLITSNVNNSFIGFFLFAWTITSVLSLKFTEETNWITQGESVAKRVYDYVNPNKNILSGKTIVFYDSPDDKSLPFSPTGIVENSLSDNNFFYVYYEGKIKAHYGASKETQNTVNISSRMFLGY